MWRVSGASVRHYPHLFAGMFVALSLGTGLVGVLFRAIFAAVSVHPRPVGTPVTLRAGNGSVSTVADIPDDMGALISILGLGATVSAMVTIMVVAGAAALSVLLRRRDVGLLRMAGAGKGTLRTMVVAEALVVAVPAVIAGSVLAAAASGTVFARLNVTSLAPVDITPGSLRLPLLIAAGSGLLIAVLGALAGSGTATRTPPHAALREATLDSGRLAPVRVVVGALFLVGGAVMVGLTFGLDDDSATPVAIFGTVFLAVGLIAFGPLFVPSLLRLGMLPLYAVDPVAGRLAATSVGTARRRTSSLVAPVLGVLTVVGIFAAVLATASAGARQDLVARDAAQLQVTSARGLSDADLRAIGSVPGVAAVAAPVPAQVAIAGRWDVTVYDAEAVDLAALGRTSRFEVVEGRRAAPRTGEVAISAEKASDDGWHVGDTVTYAVFGGRVRTDRIASVIDAGQTLPTLILPAGSVRGSPPTAQLRLDDRVPARVVAKRIGVRLAGHGIAVTPSSSARSAEQEQQDRINWIGLLILAGPAAAYSVIGIGSTIVMAGSRRGPEVSAMRMLGLTRSEVLRLACWEAFGTTLAGTVLAAGLVGFGLIAFRASEPVYGGHAPLSVPWGLLLTLAGGCLATSLAVSLLSTAHLLHRRPAAAD